MIQSLLSRCAASGYLSFPYFRSLLFTKGVFVEGAVVPGTVIALIPGVVHLSEYANQKDYIKNLLPDDDFNLLMRLVVHEIDSRKSLLQ